ncbi:MAG: CsgG/HfaB family protein [Trueperaceae bacterium]|nr:CsgG/HfaB family protein [Trueperaceae bacterium]
MLRALAVATAGLALLLAACAPTTATSGADLSALDAACATEPAPVVAVVQFENTTGRFGTTVTGVEEAATARLITLLKESGCYDIVEQSELQNVMMQQGLESMEPEALARAAGAGYVITGTVTRATIAEPGVSVFGVSLGETRADVEVDVRATDIITGSIVVSETGTGTATSPNIAVDRIPAGRIAYDDPTVGPILADASAAAVREVVAFIRAEF